jgi:hypothetical protein
VGTVVHDSARFSDTNGAIPKGTVTYQRFTTPNCTGDAVNEVKEVTSRGEIPDSGNFTAPKSLSYEAVYNGISSDQKWSDSRCEKLEITGG